MEWSKELIQQWKNGGILSRGEFYLLVEKMGIIIDEATRFALIEEFERETDPASKWGLSILLINQHDSAERFYHNHVEIKDSPLTDEDMERIMSISSSYFSMFFKNS